MVLEKPKKLSKLEVLKINSDHLIIPLKEVRSHCLIGAEVDETCNLS
jgi:hypothetical protein